MSLFRGICRTYVTGTKTPSDGGGGGGVDWHAAAIAAPSLERTHIRCLGAQLAAVGFVA